MEQNYKEFSRQQISKIRRGVQRAKIEGRKVIGFLSGGDKYYFMSLKSIRCRSLFLAIFWGCFGGLFIPVCLSVLFSTIGLISTVGNYLSDIPNANITVAAEIFVAVVAISVMAAIIIALILSIKAFCLVLAPERLKIYLIYNTVLSVLLVLALAFSDNFNIFNLIFGCILVITAFVSGIALTDINNYRDWFNGYGKKR